MKWNDTKELLPEKTGEYLAYTKCGDVTILGYSVRHKLFNCRDWRDDTDTAIEVTHWAEISELNLPERNEVQNG